MIKSLILYNKGNLRANSAKRLIFLYQQNSVSFSDRG